MLHNLNGQYPCNLSLDQWVQAISDDHPSHPSNSLNMRLLFHFNYMKFTLYLEIFSSGKKKGKKGNFLFKMIDGHG